MVIPWRLHQLPSDQCLASSCSCLYPIQWSRVLNREWRCSWSSADRRCSNYIWVINNVIAYWVASYIRELTVVCDHHHVITRASASTYLNLKACFMPGAWWWLWTTAELSLWQYQFKGYSTRCKCKQDSVGVRRILVVPRDSGGASAGFCWCIWGEMADEVAAPCKSTATQGRAALRMK